MKLKLESYWACLAFIVLLAILVNTAAKLVAQPRPISLADTNRYSIGLVCNIDTNADYYGFMWTTIATNYPTTNFLFLRTNACRITNLLVGTYYARARAYWNNGRETFWTTNVQFAIPYVFTTNENITLIIKSTTNFITWQPKWSVTITNKKKDEFFKLDIAK